MPFVRDRELDSWDRLRKEGIEVVTPEFADDLNLPEIQIGFLNMMPDRALRATERQFLRLVAAGADECLIHIRPFTISGLGRKADAREYIDRFYDSFSDVESVAFDGLVLTGANPVTADLRAEKFWPEFENVMVWADQYVPTVMCSCLASHAVIEVFHGIQRTRCLPGKRWGVYSHRVVKSDHPLVVGMETPFDAPRSHVHEMTAEQLEGSGIEILAFSPNADFHIAVSPDGFKWIFLQGHPEYDAVSLLKEFHREVIRFTMGERLDYPEYPLNYLNDSAKDRLARFKIDLFQALDNSSDLPVFPESEILPFIQNTWKDHGVTLFRNWIRQIVQNSRTDDASRSYMKSA